MPLPLLLPLMWWSAASFAADDVPADRTPPDAPQFLGTERAVASPAEVAAYVEVVRQMNGGAVLLAAAGPDAEPLAQKVAAGMPPGQARVVRVGYIGDVPEEMRRALESAGLRCGVRVATTTAGTWLVSTHGSCGPVPQPTIPIRPPGDAPVATVPTATPPAPVSSPAPAPAPAPAPSIPGLGSALPGVRVEAAQPTPVPYLTAPPPPPDPDVLAATYKMVSLARVENPTPRDDLPDASWAIRDGRGRTLAALDFAQRTGDSTTERRLTRERRTAKVLGVSLVVGGGSLVVAGLGLLVGREAGAPLWSDYEPDNGDYTNAEYFEAVAQAEADYRAAEDTHAIRVDDRTWIAGFLMGAGAITASTAPLVMQGVNDRQKVPALYWSRDEADTLLDAHNATVRQRIGMPEPEPAPVVPPPPSPEDDEDDEDLEPGLDDDPPEDMPDDAPELAPGGPSGHLLLPSGTTDLRSGPVALTVTPLLGFGWAGFTGTF